ncbi:MAG TPA: hypothetical protein VM940_02645 [Chthoniobacterales bacterium]|jgi:hypothetical protein|nr:hypothetical protein [Chthoniobacterales bacterium]
MSASTPLQLPPEDKLDVLRYLDEFHYWHSLDDERVCKRCDATITGRQVLVIELQGTRGKLRLKCPSAGCASTPSEWSYANPVQAARLRAGSSLIGDKAEVQAVANARTHHGKLSATWKDPAEPKSRSIVPAVVSLRGVLARLSLVRPIATARRMFRAAA